MFEALVTDAAEGEHVVVSFVVMKKKGSSSSAVSLGRRRRASSADVRSATKTMVPLVVPSGSRQQQHYRGGSLPDLFASGYSLPTNISVSSASEKVAKKLRSASPPLSSSPPSPSTSLFSPLPQEMLRFPTLGAMLQLECGGAGLVGGGSARSRGSRRSRGIAIALVSRQWENCTWNRWMSRRLNHVIPLPLWAVGRNMVSQHAVAGAMAATTATTMMRRLSNCCSERNCRCTCRGIV